MAATLTLTAATPHSLKYRYDHDGSGSTTATRTRAQMLADLATGNKGPSPLADLLTKTPTGSWAALPGGSQLSVYVTPSVIFAAAEQMSAQFSTVPTDQLSVAGLGVAAGSQAVVELRFNHTIDR